MTNSDEPESGGDLEPRKNGDLSDSSELLRMGRRVSRASQDRHPAKSSRAISVADEEQDDYLIDLCFLPDEGRVATAHKVDSESRWSHYSVRVQVWDPVGLNLVRTFDIPGAELAAFGASRSLLIAFTGGSFHRNIEIWDLVSASRLREVRPPFIPNGFSLEVDEAGDSFSDLWRVMLSLDGSVAICSMWDGDETSDEGGSRFDSTVLALHLGDDSSVQELYRPEPHSFDAEAIGLCSNGSVAVIAGDADEHADHYSEIRLFDTNRGVKIGSYPSSSITTAGAAISADLFLLARFGDLALLNLKTGSIKSLADAPEDLMPRRVAVSGDGAVAFLELTDDETMLYSWRKGDSSVRPLRKIPDPTGGIAIAYDGSAGFFYCEGELQRVEL